MHLAWVTSNGSDALAVGGLVGAALDRLAAASAAERASLLRILPAEALAAGRSPRVLTATPGTYAVEGDRATFVPRFPFVAGCRYAVLVHPDLGGVDDDGDQLTIERPRPERAAVAVVEAIHPMAPVIPVNTLRLYIRFSHPMAEGFAGQVRVMDAGTGDPLADALLPMEQELWDPERRRLTVLFDPARIKRGLVPHEEAGYPLEEGRTIRVEVGPGFLDAGGSPLAQPACREYRIGPLLEGRIDPGCWQLDAPPAGTRLPLTVRFDRPLDHALLQHGITVPGRRGQGADRDGGWSWTFLPDAPWPAGIHELAVAPILEDVAGNSVARPFDRDITEGDEPGPGRDWVRRRFVVA